MIKNIIKSLILLTAAATMASCDKSEIYLGGADTGVIESPDGNVVYVSDGNGRTDVGYVEFSKSFTLDLYLRSSKAPAGNVTATLSYDPEVLERYNSGNATEVPAFPADRVSLADGGKMTLAEGSLSSAPMGVSLTSDGSLDPSTVYAVPLKVNVDNGVLSGGADGYVILVQDVTAFPGTEKLFEGKPGMKIVGVFEVNDHNPLNALGFTMKGSGKQFFDIVVLFSANINYDAATGRVYVSRNENVQALLDQRQKYIVPLQQRGIKVVLGILGNHDISGVSTLGNERAREFAKEVKQVCDAYQLDGIFLDDEYTDYEAAKEGKIPGFVRQSTEAASRLAYEIRCAQPSRLLLSYRYQALYRSVAVNGMQPSEIWDYVLNDYKVTDNPVSTYPGLRQDQAGTGSWNCSDRSQWIPSNPSWTGLFSLTGMRKEGYGALMIYNFQCSPTYGLTRFILNDVGQVARDFWNGEIDYDGSWYPKDY